MSTSLNPNSDKFLGTWKVVEINNSTTSSEVFTFFSDGIVGVTNMIGTWEFKDGKLILIFDIYQYVYSYCFSNNDRTLTWSAMNKITTYILTKQAEIN